MVQWTVSCHVQHCQGSSRVHGQSVWFTEEDVLDAMLLEPVDDQQLASQTLEEETTLFSEP